MTDGLLTDIGRGFAAFATNTPLSQINAAAQERQRAAKQRELIEQLRANASNPNVLQGGAFRQLAASDPQMARQFSEAIGTSDAARQQAFFDDARKLHDFMKAADFQSAGELLSNRLSDLQAIGGDTRATEDFANRFNLAMQDGIDAEEAANLTGELAGIVELGRQQGAFGDMKPDRVQSSQYVPGLGFVQQLAGGEVRLEELPETAQAQVKEAQERQAEMKARAAEQRAEGTATGKGAATRAQNFINEGVDAAEGIPVLRRSIQLLDSIDTGGIRQAALRAKQFFGVEGADEAELSNNLGKAVLSQLKATFGAQFTEKEGERLDRIEANYGKSTAGNKRLLEQTLRIATNAVKRGIRSARDSEDVETADELQRFLDGDFDLSIDLEEVAEQTPQTQALMSSALGREVTEQDIQDTLAANPGLTREQLFKQLGIQ